MWVIHNNIELPGVTGAPLDEIEGTPGALLLQDDGDLVRYPTSASCPCRRGAHTPTSSSLWRTQGLAEAT